MEVKSIEARKRALRAQLKQARSALPQDERTHVDRAILRHLCALPAFAQAQLVLTYLSFGSEVDTYGIIERAWDAGKTVAIPRCEPSTHALSWHRLTAFDELERSPLGMLEPPAGTPCLYLGRGQDSLALVPGLAFDRMGQRLGYGGGYYDRFLARFAGSSVGLCSASFVVDSLRAAQVVDARDLPVTVVLTEDGVLGA